MFSDDGSDLVVIARESGFDRERVRLARARARVGHWVHKWRLTSLLGIGGTASVYAATHRNGARVALKIMHPELASDPERCARFQREGYAANLVGHPGVVSIHDDGVDEHGQPFLVMELLRGASLQSLLGAAPRGLPLEQVLGWAWSLLEILECAHSKRVLHRDIKPSNLFLDEQGRLRVLDFGLAGGAAFSESSGAVTVSGSIQGTPAFMPPEQARGDWVAVDARSDLWATGATLFTLLSGEHVHPAASSQEQLGMAMVVSPRSLRAAKPELPDEVIQFVDRALQFEPDRRFQSAREMAAACRVLAPLAGRLPGDASLLRADVFAPPDRRLETQRTATLSIERAGISRRRPRSVRRLWFAATLALLAVVFVAIAARKSERELAPSASPTAVAAVEPALTPLASGAPTRASAVAERTRVQRETILPRETVVLRQGDEGRASRASVTVAPKVERSAVRPPSTARTPASNFARPLESEAPRVESSPPDGRVRLVDRPELMERK
jgi:serine/threonine protein kinase